MSNITAKSCVFYGRLLSKTDSILRRAGGMDTNMLLMSLHSGATLAALVIGAIVRTLKLSQ